MPIETFLKNCREVMRLKHLSYRTEQTYLPVIRRFIEFHGGRTHPRDMGAAEIRAYLSHLAVEQNVAASTQNVAFSALLFLYRDVLHIDLPAIGQVERAQRPARLPEVFTREEARAVLGQMQRTPRPMASLLYGSGLRLMECVRLRVKDVDFPRAQLTIREGKGEKDRVTMLPQSLTAPLQLQLEQTKRIHEEDLATGFGAAEPSKERRLPLTTPPRRFMPEPAARAAQETISPPPVQTNADPEDLAQAELSAPDSADWAEIDAAAHLLPACPAGS
jgi:site-specific recombinase XerD